MAHLTILGREFDLAPYKLGALRRAAPHIDAMNAIGGALTTMEGMVESASHMIAIVAIGLEKLDPVMTAAHIEDEMGLDDLPALGAAVRDLLAESGLAAKGEAQATSPEPEEASSSSSETSSASSSPAA